MANKVVTSALVRTDCLAGVVVVLKNGIVLESRVRRGNGKPSGTGKQLDATKLGGRSLVRGIFAHNARAFPLSGTVCNRLVIV